MQPATAEPRNGHLQLVALIAQIEPNSAPSIAGRLIGQFGSLGALMAASPAAQLRATPDCPQIVALLSACQAVMMHVLCRVVDNRPVLSSSDALFDYLHASMAHAVTEQVRALFMDARLRVIRDDLVGLGSVDEAHVNNRLIIQRCFDLGASGLILVHNHPSGCPEPSRSDISFTRQLAIAAKALSITLHDHVIVARTGSTSFRGLGLM